MRGPDGQTWPWGNGMEGLQANFDGDADGYPVTALWDPSRQIKVCMVFTMEPGI